jgi:hypothetical protein
LAATKLFRHGLTLIIAEKLKAQNKLQLFENTRVTVSHIKKRAEKTRR